MSTVDVLGNFEGFLCDTDLLHLSFAVVTISNIVLVFILVAYLRLVYVKIFDERPTGLEMGFYQQPPPATADNV